MPDLVEDPAALSSLRPSVRSELPFGGPDWVTELDLEIGLRERPSRKPQGPSEHSEDLRRSDSPVFRGMLSRGPCPRSVDRTRAGFPTSRSTLDGGSSIDHDPIGMGFVSVVI
jgi:hypothetical protein